MTITTESSSSGGFDRTNNVVVIDKDGNRYKLQAQMDYVLNYGNSFTGTIVYLEHSGFVIWYNIDS